MHYISRGRRPPKQSFFTGLFDENLRFIGSKLQFVKILALAVIAALVSYVYILLLLVAFG